MSKVAPAGDILDEAERLTATPGIHYDYAIVVPKVSPAYLKELKERVENAGFVTEEFDALSGQYEVSILKLGAPQQRLMEFAFAQGVPGRLDPAKLQAAAAALNPPLAFNEKPAEMQCARMGYIKDIVNGKKELIAYSSGFGEEGKVFVAAGVDAVLVVALFAAMDMNVKTWVTVTR